MNGIRFPKLLQLGFRPFYGLTIRQLFYILFAVVSAIALVLTGPSQGAEFVVRVLTGLALIVLAIGIAFVRVHGLSVERWLYEKARYTLGPQRRVWTRGGGLRHDDVRIDLGTPSATAHAPIAPIGGVTPIFTGASQEMLIVLIDTVMVFALTALVIYLARGGWSEVEAMWSGWH